MADPAHSDTGPLTPEQVRLVKESWSDLAKRRGLVTRRFYSRLFELDPSLKSLFDETDMEQQGKKFADTLTFAVRGLDHFDILGPAIGQLGARHIDYGVEDRHYELVREALFDSFRSNLGARFTEEIESAWLATYNALAEAMKKGPGTDSATIPGI